MRPVFIPADRGAYVVYLVSALVFCALGVFVMVAMPREDGAGLVIGGLTLIFFGAVALFALVSLMGPRRGLRMDESGIEDRVSAFSAGVIPWRAIARAEITTWRGVDYIALTLRDPRAFRRRAGLAKRLVWALNSAMAPGSGVMIDTATLKIDADRLLAEIERRRG